ncbi:pre-mRNA splicing factor [Purpureocillium lavendulum]|uniref:Pre-mRNA splicing factor n=1 Tax=Purpureocillium lavendulum TaxID=1247861 RepID=A0AB34FMX9_9HYPO|nr:pre-mRNA splicing factor [Purpureocillium lavendulum]
MTRVSVYSGALVAFVAATGMIIASIVTPNWVTYSVTTPKGERFEKHIGLHRSCSSLDSPPCRDFPPAELCQDGERYFCSMWRTIGFMASLATILCLACLVTFGVIMRGGKYKRETGWPVVSGILALVAIVEFVIISIVAYLFDNDDQFTIPGWSLDFSWYLSTFSAAICFFSALGLAVSAYLLPPEEGYEFLDDPLDA